MVGPSGTGKSHFAEAICHAAIDADLRVSWFTLESLTATISRSKVDASTAKVVARICFSELIVVDDIGLLPAGEDEAEALYRLVPRGAGFMTRGLILSVKPRYAARILDGTKSTELRTRRVAAPQGITVIVYATSPRRAIVGTARLRRVMMAAPEAAWEAAGDSLALDRQEFDRYTSGRTAISLLFLEAVTPLDHPILLTDLRNGHRFHPPQGYRYVSSADPEAVRALIPADDSSPATILPAPSWFGTR